MKKISILSVILLISGSIVNASWYSDGTGNFSVGNGATAKVSVICSGDGISDEGGAELLGQISTSNLSTNAPLNGTVNCESWDSKKPDFSKVSLPTAWTDGNVVIDVSCNDLGGSGCNMVDISGWTKSGNTYTKTITINETGSFNIVDGAGNATLVSYEVGNIDKEGPLGIVTYSHTDWTNTNVDISIECDDASGIGCDMLDRTGWTKLGNTYSKTVSANESGDINIVDELGNLSTVVYEVSKIDKITPVFNDIFGAAINLLAGDITASIDEDFNFEVVDNGDSPIDSIIVFFENTVNDIIPLDLVDKGTQFIGSSSVSIPSINLTNTNNGSREYSLLIDEICDKAGNCLNDMILNYNVIDGEYVENIELLSAYTGELNDGKLKADIKGNFDQLFLQFASGGLDYVIAVPSLIAENTGSGDFIDIIDNKSVTYDSFGNVPETFDGLQSEGADLEFSNNDIVLFKGLLDLTNDNDLNLIANNLRNYYDGSVLTLSEDVMNLLSKPNSELIKFIRPKLKQTNKDLSITYLWSLEDSSCNNPDISIDGQTWAGCNSTLGTITSFTSKKCYSSSGTEITCSDSQVQSTANEEDLIFGGVNNIWGAHYTGINAITACPSGWKVPSNEDFEKLERNLGCTDYDQVGWRCKDLGADRDISDLGNLVNVLNIPMSGYIDSGELNIGLNTYLWTSTVSGLRTARQLYISDRHVEKTDRDETNIYSVRCIKE